MPEPRLMNRASKRGHDAMEKRRKGTKEWSFFGKNFTIPVIKEGDIEVVAIIATGKGASSQIATL